MPSYVILAIGAFDYIYSKTGNMLIRYRPDEVVAVIDPGQAGKTANQVLGWGGDIPCVASFNGAKDFSPTHLVVGSAPPGGVLNDDYRREIIAAIQSGCHIIAGMHVFLNDDPEIFKLASDMGLTLTDLRRPPIPPHFPKGSWGNPAFPVLLIVGCDCDTGTMTTAW